MEIKSSIGLKRLNFQKVYRYLYDVHSASKLEISMGTGLSIPTITSNIVSLVDLGLVNDGKELKSTGGRRAQGYSICPDARIAIGVELLKEEVKVLAVDLYGKILSQEKIEMEFQNNQSYFDRFGDFVNGFISSLEYLPERILGIGISLQGLVSEDGETVTYSEILKAEGLKLETFNSLFKYKCRMFHDTEAAALAEMWDSPKTGNAVYIALNRSFGGTLILNGEVRKIQKLSGATIEHMRINPDGPLCYCGKRGCAETYCSSNRLKQAAGMSIKEFFLRLHSGDSRCKELWDEYARNLAIVIENVNMVVSCDVIIGGYLLSYMDDNDFDAIRKAVNEEVFIKGTSRTLIRSRLGDKAPATGAAIDFIEQFINEL